MSSFNPFSIPSSLLNEATIKFDVERDNSVICSSRGFFCGKNYPSTIQLVENVDIKTVIGSLILLQTNAIMF